VELWNSVKSLFDVLVAFMLDVLAVAATLQCTWVWDQLKV